VISISALNFFNATFAFSTALLVFRALNRMDRGTDHALRVSFALVCAGLIGEAFSSVLTESWQHSVDVLLFGGLMAAFLGTRRVSEAVLLTNAWRARLSLAVSVLTFVVFLAGIS
jgi:hypothetical protein